MSNNLREDALAIWKAGVEAVLPERVLPEWVAIQGNTLCIGEQEFELTKLNRVAVIGGGKAGAGMALALEEVLGEQVLSDKQVTGLLSVPADCVQPTKSIELIAGRPAGINEPRPEGAAAAQRMLELVDSLGPNDLCLCLLSGGGSALLPAPIEGVSLEQKIAVTKLLSGAGATIDQLNAVRKRLSTIKGGGLLRACQAGNLVSLIISDVLGDPLDVIASGPTVPNQQSLAEAKRVFVDLGLVDHPDALPIIAALDKQAETPVIEPTTNATNYIIANNAVAVDAAGMEAERRGYNHVMDCARSSEGPAEEVGQHLARMAMSMQRTLAERDDSAGLPNCLITGGEPTVTLADSSIRGRGGRNQQLVLAALETLQQANHNCQGIAMLSGGTDGEDGPTDAAGAMIDEAIAKQAVEQAVEQNLNAADHLARNDAYPFFKSVGGLIKTGATNTNVCDVRVVTVKAKHS